VEVDPEPRQGHFLVVDDDETVARGFWRLLRDIRPTHLAHSGAQARQLLETHGPFCGFLVDVDLGAESGLDVLTFARERYPLVPAAVITGHTERESINRAFALRASYVCKPVEKDELMPFVYRCLAAEVTADDRVAALIESLVRRHTLSTREAELLVAAVAGTSRKTILQSKGISGNTLKTQIRHLLQKLDAPNLDEVAMGVLRAALLGTGLAGPTAPTEEPPEPPERPTTGTRLKTAPAAPERKDKAG
jgi:DNA-binding NarL/FixJ family response regulator